MIVEKNKIDVGSKPSVEDIMPLIKTLNKQYGLWTDKDYKKIESELIEAAKLGHKSVLEVFTKYYSEYVEFARYGDR